MTKPIRRIPRVECKNCVFCRKQPNSNFAICAKNWWRRTVTWLDVIHLPITARCPYFQGHVEIDTLGVAKWSDRLDGVTVVETLEAFRNVAVEEEDRA